MFGDGWTGTRLRLHQGKKHRRNEVLSGPCRIQLRVFALFVPWREEGAHRTHRQGTKSAKDQRSSPVSLAVLVPSDARPRTPPKSWPERGGLRFPRSLRALSPLTPAPSVAAVTLTACRSALLIRAGMAAFALSSFTWIKPWPGLYDTTASAVMDPNRRHDVLPNQVKEQDGNEAGCSQPPRHWGTKGF